jgi:hypothetical protein
MKNVIKFLAFLGGLILIFAGLSSIFLIKSSDYIGWGMTFTTWGILMIWYWKKK